MHPCTPRRHTLPCTHAHMLPCKHASLQSAWCTHARIYVLLRTCVFLRASSYVLLLHLLASTRRSKHVHSDMRARACACMQWRLVCLCARTNGVEEESRTVMGAAKGMVRRQMQGVGVQGVSLPLVRWPCLCPLVYGRMSGGAVCVAAPWSRGALCLCPLPPCVERAASGPRPSRT
jgi:hypothetical protein